MKIPELLAPAGSLRAFIGAVNAGADAVYFGGTRFGARAYAENFTEEEAVRAIRYARLMGVRTHMTVNTLLRGEELSGLADYLAPYVEAGLTAVIVQDFGVLRTIREAFPALHIHASTQMAVTGVHGARMLKEMGVTRVVPARELSLEELRRLSEEGGIEVEAFIHGAMCYCYSGMCLFSGMIGGRSGNRGRCAQACRMPYGTKEDPAGEYYLLSMKDMCTIDDLRSLCEAGVAALKIEGRMKKAEYAAGVTSVYRKYLDALAEGKEMPVSQEDRALLSSLYLRTEVQTGYLRRHNGREMITMREGAYNKTEEELLRFVAERYLDDRKKRGIRMRLSLVPEQPAALTLSAGATVVSCTGDVARRPKTRPLAEEEIQRQLEKLGDTDFVSEETEVSMPEEVFLPLRALGELRREGVRLLTEALLREGGGEDD
ncbi:MAG: U32 family peptidase [Lachnospiraceae bacterium]|nr:U32 family peptidase [Lachnospiraceae bacterium]